MIWPQVLLLNLNSLNMKTILLICFTFFLFGFTYSQSNYSETEVNNMINTYSYYLGQLKTVNEITNNHPHYKLKAKTAQDLWNIKFRLSIENIITELKKIYGNKFNEIENEILANISLIDFSEVKNEDIENTIEIIKQRANGEIPSPFLETLLTFNPTYQNSPEKEMIDGYINDYYTSESEKSNGLNIKIKYPKSWKAKNGDRPNVVQKFTSDNGHGLEVAILMINKLNEPLNNEQIEYFLTKEVLEKQLPKKSEIISYQKDLKMDNINAASLTFYSEQTQMNVKLGSIIEFYIFYYNNCQVTLMFSVGQIENKRDDIYKRYEMNKKLFWRMANNVVLLSQYE